MSQLNQRIRLFRQLWGVRRYSETEPKTLDSLFLKSGPKETKRFDLVVVGGGIIGTASARELQLRYPEWNVAVVEKESRLAAHQSSHSSGVIHAGVYYTPGSLKAKLCVEGMQLMYNYLDENRIPYKKVGKLIVATNAEEVSGLEELHKRGTANRCRDLQMIDGDRIREIEPYCEGVKALWSPHTGIVDYGLVTEHCGRDLLKAGGQIILNFNVKKFYESTNPDYPVTIESKNCNTVIQTKYVLTCGGLHSDQLSEMTGCSRSPRIVPIRGEYLVLSPSKAHMIKGNIYPVPDPRFPFLGVHFTPRLDGSIWIGPNAVLALKREGYKWSDINLADLFDALRYRGFHKLARKHFRYGTSEMMKSLLIALQIPHIQKFIPDINELDLECGPAGVRAQALDEDGNLVDDFVFEFGSGDSQIKQYVLHCRNAPSPGATSSLAIAKMIADRVALEFRK